MAMQEPAVLEEIVIDSDDLSYELLPELEDSFGITLPHDLRHVVTVGDLLDEVTQLREAIGATARWRSMRSGEHCQQVRIDA